MEFRTFGEWLRHRRLKLDISPFKMAEDLGYKRVSAIYNFEYGVAPLPMPKWATMAAVLEVPLDRFLTIIERYAPHKVAEFRAIQSAPVRVAEERLVQNGVIVPQAIPQPGVEGIRTHGLEGAPLAIVFRGSFSDGAVHFMGGLLKDEERIGWMEVSDPQAFPAQEVVERLKKASTIAVLEGDRGYSLAAAIKAAFLDALTGAGGYPHIHRVPKIYSAVLDPDIQVLEIEILKYFLGVLKERPDERAIKLSARSEVRA